MIRAAECEFVLRDKSVVCLHCLRPHPMVVSVTTDLTRLHRRCANVDSPRNKNRYDEGPGTELHAILAGRGYEVGEKCKCKRTIKAMNMHGPEWCLATIDKIADVMVEEARRRKIKVLGIEPPELALRLQGKRWIKQAVRIWSAKATGQKGVNACTTNKG